MGFRATLAIYREVDREQVSKHGIYFRHVGDRLRGPKSNKLTKHKGAARMDMGTRRELRKTVTFAVPSWEPSPWGRSMARKGRTKRNQQSQDNVHTFLTSSEPKGEQNIVPCFPAGARSLSLRRSSWSGGSLDLMSLAKARRCAQSGAENPIREIINA